jgi:hypothetical protein
MLSIICTVFSSASLQSYVKYWQCLKSIFLSLMCWKQLRLLPFHLLFQLIHHMLTVQNILTFLCIFSSCSYITPLHGQENELYANSTSALRVQMVTSPLKLKLAFIIFNHSVHTSRKAQPITFTRIKWLRLFKKIITVYAKNHMKLINTFCGQNT